MRIRFTSDFDYSPAAFKGRVTIAYRASDAVKVVKRECGLAAVAAGKGVEVKGRGQGDGQNPRG